MQNFKWCIGLVILLCSATVIAQGPPITGDKPIMLGGNSWVIKNLTEFRNTDVGEYIHSDMMLHYLPSANLLFAVHLPWVYYDSDNGQGQSFGDLGLVAKYQFYRKDKHAATFRMVAKTLQTFGTGKSLAQEGISEGEYQNYLGIVAGYESLKLGVIQELGHSNREAGNGQELHYKLGIGVPLLPPKYPVSQINLHTEFHNSWYTDVGDFQVLVAQGAQYAIRQFTIEAAFQFPLFSDLSEVYQRNHSWIIGGRYIF